MSVKFEEINYKSYGKCIKVDNSICSLIITVDVGPRIISCSMNGKENLFLEDINNEITNDSKELKELFGEDKTWYIYGGHRLWYSPEAFPNSYYPDNTPVKYSIDGNKIILIPDPQVENGVQYEIVVTVSENEGKVLLDHKIINISDKDIKLAPWALTVTDKGGLQIIPQCDRETGLLSNRNMIVWPYTDLTDDRLFIGNRFITIQQDKNATSSLKIGTNNEKGTIALINKGQLFVKKYEHLDGFVYPDFGCSFEGYTSSVMMEVETLGPLTTIKPMDSITHTENWFISNCDEIPNRRDEKSITDFMTKNVD